MEGEKLNLLNILNIFREYKDIIVILVVIFLSLVEITPIKINPWTCLIKWVSHVQGLDKLNEEVGNIRLHMDEIDTKIDNLRTESEEKSALKDALLYRHRILRFSDELTQNIKHSQEMFNDILADITEYDNYCRTHPTFVNQKAVMSEENIKRIYRKCLEERDFL